MGVSLAGTRPVCPTSSPAPPPSWSSPAVVALWTGVTTMMLAVAAVLVLVLVVVVVAGQSAPSGPQDAIAVSELAPEPGPEYSAVVLGPLAVVSETVVVRVIPLRTVAVPAEPDGAGWVSVAEGDGRLGWGVAPEI